MTNKNKTVENYDACVSLRQAALNELPKVLALGNDLIADSNLYEKQPAEYVARASQFRCRALHLMQMFGNCEHFQHADYLNTSWAPWQVLAQTVGALRALNDDVTAELITPQV
jgi:hypothetical protein